jgi:hypothetical protein
MATQAAAGSAPGRAWSPYGAYPPAAPAALNERPQASSSQPTGWRGRRPASTAPTVAALTVATVGATAVPSGSDRPARRSKTSSQKPAARPSMASAHSAHASPAGHQRGWASRTAEVTAVVLAACSPPPSPSPAHQVPAWPIPVSAALRTAVRRPRYADRPSGAMRRQPPRGSGAPAFLADLRSAPPLAAIYSLSWWLLRVAQDDRGPARALAGRFVRRPLGSVWRT